MRSAPGDGIAGSAVRVCVVSRRRVRVRPVSRRAPSRSSGHAGGTAPVDEVVMLVPARRGVHHIGRRSTSRRRRRSRCSGGRSGCTLPLPSALHVSPRCGRAQPVPLRPDEGTGDMLERPRSDEGLPRGARPYVPGDARRLVHWRSTAHTGRLMVREVEQPAAEPVTITVELPADPDAAERVAEGALGSVVRLLEGGAPGPARDQGGVGPCPRARGRPAQRRAPPRPRRRPAPGGGVGP